MIKKNEPSGKTGVFWKIAVVFCAACCIVLFPGYMRVAKLKKSLALLEKDSNRLREENEKLRVEIERLEKDPAAIEEIARKLGWVKKGELRVKFVAPDTKTQDTKKKKGKK